MKYYQNRESRRHPVKTGLVISAFIIAFGAIGGLSYKLGYLDKPIGWAVGIGEKIGNWPIWDTVGGWFHPDETSLGSILLESIEESSAYVPVGPQAVFSV